MAARLPPSRAKQPPLQFIPPENLPTLGGPDAVARAVDESVTKLGTLSGASTSSVAETLFKDANTIEFVVVTAEGRWPANAR